MRLSKLLEPLKISIPTEYECKEIYKICDNSKECDSDAIFVAIKGNRANGEDYIKDAYKRGCRVFICSNKKIKIAGSIVLIVKNPRKTLAVLCARICGNPEKLMKIVGITGTKGKSTTGSIISQILNKFSARNIFIGTLGIISDFKVETANTTPSPCMIFPALKKAFEEGIRYAIIEVSSQALKDYRIYGIPFFITVFTSLGNDHIGEFEHKSRADYIRAKRSLFTKYNSRLSVINGDDAYSSYISSGIKRTLKCGFYYHNNVIIDNYKELENGSSFSVGELVVCSSLHGRFNAINLIMAIISAALLLKTDVSVIAPLCKNICVEGRMEEYLIDGKHIIIDYAHTPESFAEVSSLARKLYNGKQIAVFGSVSDRAFGRRELLACAAEELFDFSFITGDDASGNLAMDICEEIYSYFSDKTFVKIEPDREKAIKYAVKYAKEGDVVLLLGRGHEKTIVEDGVKKHFSEREIIEKIQHFLNKNKK